LARPVRLTLGGLTAALESVVEEGKLGLTSIFRDLDVPG
jgi:hypothetical protein